MKYSFFRASFAPLALSFLAFTACGTKTVQASDVTVAVSPNRSQKIKGWGWYARPDLKDQPTATQNDIFALNANYIRVELPPEAGLPGGAIDAGKLNHIIADIKLAQAHNISGYVVSIWSPPIHMKGPQQIKPGITSNGMEEYLRQDQETNFARYVADAVEALNRSGAGLPTVLSIQNEPDVAPVWQGCKYTMNSDSIASWRRVIKATRAALDAKGFNNVKLVGPETSWLSTNFSLLGNNFSALATDPALNTAIAGFAIHSYSVLDWDKVGPALKTYPRDIWMLEWSDAEPPATSTDLDWTIHAAQRMNGDFIDLGVHYWFWWEVWKPKDKMDGEALLCTLNGSSSVTRSRMYYFFHKLWNEVRPDWSVKQAMVNDNDNNWANKLKGNGSGQGWNNVDIMAFENPSATSTVVVVVNPTKTGKVITNLSGLKGSNAMVYETNQWENMALKRSIPIINGAIQSAGLPAYGTQIIICK